MNETDAPRGDDPRTLTGSQGAAGEGGERPTAAGSTERMPAQPAQVQQGAAPRGGYQQGGDQQAAGQAMPERPAAPPSAQPGQPARTEQFAWPQQPSQPPQGYGQPQGQPAQFGPQPQNYGQTQQGQQPQGTSFYRPAQGSTPQQGRRWGTGVLVGGMLVAGLLGGGVAAGSAGLLAPQSTGKAATVQSAPLIVNNQDSVNAVTAAAAKAAPSVVTIGVTSGNSSGTGSGVVVDGEGHILTNTHVVTLDGQAANPSIEVRASDGSVYKAKLVGTDPLSDLAVVKVDGAQLPAVTFGDSSRLNVGDIAVAIGAPLGLDNTVTDGIISTLNRTISVASSAVPEGGDNSQNNGQDFQFAPPGQGQQPSNARSSVSINVIQTDAAINPGNSGGALVDSKGQLIGINVAIASAGSGDATGTAGNIGVGFSVPANYAHRIAEEIIANGKATHGQLGVSVRPHAANGTSSSFSSGAQVEEVTGGGAADKAGIRTGDVITDFAGRHIGDASELTAAVREQAAGATVKVTLERNGQSMELDVTLGSAS
ncbi:S1C family serine protease [Sinomonas mesophila]|uniref:S1C family serine protease n=1 Tax=Sinomonas mesophila TaxID=1531955 RepID=UPI001FE6C875|nr:trypsin-like peptidase domain-containing protein [Sinomonas mesophila]